MQYRRVLATMLYVLTQTVKHVGQSEKPKQTGTGSMVVLYRTILNNRQSYQLSLLNHNLRANTAIRLSDRVIAQVAQNGIDRGAVSKFVTVATMMAMFTITTVKYVPHHTVVVRRIGLVSIACAARVAPHSTRLKTVGIVMTVVSVPAFVTIAVVSIPRLNLLGRRVLTSYTWGLS